MNTLSPEATIAIELKEKEALLPQIDMTTIPERWQSELVGHEVVHSTGLEYVPGQFSPYIRGVPGSYENIPPKLIWAISTGGDSQEIDIYNDVRGALWDMDISRLSSQRKEHIVSTAPLSIPVSEFKNGLIMVDPGIWQDWMSVAGLKAVKDRLIILRKPDFIKTNLKDDEVFLESKPAELWVKLPRPDEITFNKREQAYDYSFMSGYRPNVNEILRVAEWEAKIERDTDGTITVSRDGLSHTISPSYYAGVKAKESIFISTNTPSIKVVVGTDESDNDYITYDDVKKLYGQNEEVDKEILKPTGHLIVESIDHGVSAEQIAERTGLDLSRIQSLIELRNGWNGAHLVECKIENTTRRSPYIACILPDVLDGQTIEHAVAENAELGNAVFIVDGTMADWQEVLLDKTKQEAVDLGAKRVVHSGNWTDRVLDAITISSIKR